MKKRQQTITSNGKKYRTLNTDIRNKFRQAKEEWLNKMFVEIERRSVIHEVSMHKRIKD